MEIRLLGVVQAVDGDRRIAVGGAKERALLAFFALNAGRPLSQDRLIDALWNDAPPPAASRSLHVRIANLRRALGKGAIARTGSGYALTVAADSVDALRFERLVSEAQAASEDERLARLRDALDLWDGEPLLDAGNQTWVEEERRRLDALHRQALEDELAVRLEVTPTSSTLVPELEKLIALDPLRERPRQLLMLALYRAGRQAEALDVYRQTHRFLGDELGIEPGPGLRELEHAILAQDPSLDQPAGPAERRERRRPVHRTVAAGAVAVTVVAAVAVAGVFTLGGHPRRSPTVSPRPPRIRANTVVRLDPRTHEPRAVVPVGGGPVDIVATRAALWVANQGDRTVSQIPLATGRARTIGGAPFAYGIAADRAGSLWLTSGETPVVTRISSGTGSFGTPAAAPETIHVPFFAGAEAVGGGYLWVANGGRSGSGAAGRNQVSRIDLRTHRLVSPITLPQLPLQVAFGYGAAWIGSYDHDALRDLVSIVTAGSSRPETVVVEPHELGGPLDIAVGAGSVWVLTFGGTLVRIDPETRRILARIRIGPTQPYHTSQYESFAVAAGAGSVWVTNRADTSVSKVDPRTNRVVRTIPIGSLDAVPCGIAATARDVWVTIGPDTDCGSSATR